MIPDTTPLQERIARNDAARTILAIRDRYSEDHDRLLVAEPHPMLDEYQRKLAWLIRELNRAAEWARTGSDPGDGYSGSARRVLDAYHEETP